MPSLSRRATRAITLAALTAVGALGVPAAAHADQTITLPGPVFQEIKSGDGYEGVEYNGHYYFAADDGTHGVELWRTDGTQAGTTMVADLDPGAANTNPFNLTVAGGRLFFNPAGPGQGSLDGVYVYDGTGIPVKVTTEANGSASWIVGAAGDYLLTVGYINHHVKTGNHVLRSIAPGATHAQLVGGTPVTPNVQGSRSTYGGELNGWRYFQALKTTSDGVQVGWELYRSNGVVAQLVADINPGTAGSDPNHITVSGDKVFFTAFTAATNRELWVTDGTEAGTRIVKEHNPGSAASSLGDYTGLGGQFFYTVNDPYQGREPWVSNGTEAGTRVAKDIVPGTGDSGPSQFTAATSKVYFRTNQGPWVTDATDAGTFQLATPANDGYGVRQITTFGDRAYFVAGSKENGSMLWRTLGTPATTAPISAGAYTGSTGNASAGTVGVLGHKILFSTVYPGDAGRKTWRKLSFVDTTLPDPPAVAAPGAGPDGTPHGPIAAPELPALTVKTKKSKLKISGRARVGSTLTAAKPSFAQKGVKVTYRWYTQTKKKVKTKVKVKLKSGKIKTTTKTKTKTVLKSIKNATKRTLKLTSKQHGKRIVVKVTAKKDGFAPLVLTYKATKLVAKR